MVEQRAFIQVLRAALCVGPRMNKGLIELSTGQQAVGRSQSKIKHLLPLSAFQKSLHSEEKINIGKICV